MRSRIALLAVLALAAAATAPAASDWDLRGNTGTQAGDFLGTTDDRPLDLRVNNLRAWRFQYSTWWIQGSKLQTSTTVNVLGGHFVNAIPWPAFGATIGGGGLRAMDATTGTIDDWANVVGQPDGTIGGGIGNHVSGNIGCIGSVDCWGSTVSGGQANQADESWFAMLGGGVANAATSGYGTVGGGNTNHAASWAVVPGGAGNLALGDDSFAAGCGAPAPANSFVWSDSSGTVASAGTSQFLVHAAGGVGINVNNLGATLDVGGSGRFTGPLTVGALAGGGSLPLCLSPGSQLSFCSSSLRYKTGIESFTRGVELLERLQPIAFTWREPGTKDLGLGAEPVAEVEPRLVTYNQEGEVEGVKYDRIAVVLINAIQEQQAELERQRQMIDEQDRQLADLQALLDRTPSAAHP